MNKFYVLLAIMAVAILGSASYTIILHEQNVALRNEGDQLSSSYANLQTEYSQLNTTYQMLEVNYTTLQNAYNSYKGAYRDLASNVNLHILPSSPPDYKTPLEKKFITPDAVAAKVQTITGGWGNRSDWNEFWQDVRAMYDWILNNIKYSYMTIYPKLPDDPHEYVSFYTWPWQLPYQTLANGRGACYDMSTLLTSMILHYSDRQIEVECIAVTGQPFGHTAVYFPMKDGKICILDPSGRYYTGYPNSITTVDIYEGISEWFDLMIQRGMHPICVSRIFSEYIWKDFVSTNEFITWLYERTAD